MTANVATSKGINWKKWILFDVLLAFVAFSAWVVYTHGYIGLFELAIANAATTQVLIDLVIACSLGIFWMVPNAKQNNISPWPFVLMTITLGSIGLLSYLFWREHVTE
ncbi:MAG: DUF2834 domain-containing protein [Gammaproteobacteria bacterium]|nr:DUF2834 domain-containing protein [Gammaproteobacteria bacterium]